MNKIAKTLVLLLALAHMLIAGYVMVNQLTHKAILNSAECLHAQFAYQAGQGERLFGGYEINVQPLHYTPMTFQLAGWFGRLWGYDIRAMRFVIAVFALLAFVVFWKIVFQLTKDRWLAWVAVGLLCGIDVQSHWYVYLDANLLHTFFALLAVFLILRDPTLKWSTVVLSTFSLFACYWSKHTGLGYLLAGLFYFLIRDLRKGAAASLLGALLVGGTALYFIRQPDSSFVPMLFSHGHDPLRWEWFWNPVLFPEYLGRFGIFFAVMLAGFVAYNGFHIKKWLDPFFVFLGAAAVVGTITRLKYGSGPTQAIFFYALLIACGVWFLQRFWQDKQLGSALLLSLLAIQCAALFHSVSAAIITPEDDARFQRVLDILATPGKKTFYNNHGFMNVLVGKPPVTNVGLINRSDNIRKFYAQDPFDLVIIGVPLEDSSGFLYERLEKNYAPVQEIPQDPRGPNQTLRYRMMVFQRKDQLPVR
ncbi:MAG TPA: hypothetical protein DCZ95_09600 [Verrucomicrobia bacterium]|nr:MAG: hypothetical protein A2X46_10490 [Lentisphaerae bacterium GWF2_57_35]HBA84334.1 hypothetical protein [Verrucomicrobiota bacterium]